MCMADDADGWVTILQESTPTARKSHVCTECYRTISSGEKYLYESYVYDGEFHTCKTCAHCQVVRKWLLGECGGFIYTQTEEDIREHAESRNYGFAVKKLFIGMSRQWERKDGRQWPIPRIPKTTHERMAK